MGGTHGESFNFIGVQKIVHQGAERRGKERKREGRKTPLVAQKAFTKCKIATIRTQKVPIEKRVVVPDT